MGRHFMTFDEDKRDNKTRPETSKDRCQAKEIRKTNRNISLNFLESQSNIIKI